MDNEKAALYRDAAKAGTVEMGEKFEAMESEHMWKKAVKESNKAL